MSLSEDIAKVIELASARQEKTAAAPSGVASDSQDGKIPEWVEKLSSDLRDADSVSAADVAQFLGANR